jgi:hypothetical protein
MRPTGCCSKRKMLQHAHEGLVTGSNSTIIIIIIINIIVVIVIIIIPKGAIVMINHQTIVLINGRK